MTCSDSAVASKGVAGAPDARIVLTPAMIEAGVKVLSKARFDIEVSDSLRKL